MIAGFTDRQNGSGLGSVPRASFHRTHPTFQVSDAPFHHIRGWVADARINVACLLQCKQTRCAVCALQIIGRGLIDRHCSAAGCGFGLIARVQLTGCKTKFAFCCEHRTLLEFDLPAQSEEVIGSTLKKIPLLKVQEEAHTIPSSHLPDQRILLSFCRSWHRVRSKLLAFSETLIADG